jgi:regulator of protease activity HflC (stomatin/prohibitin superfamily)
MIVIVGSVLVGVIVLASLSIRVVRENRRLLVLRLGRLNSVLGPGVVFLIPFVDQPVDVDLDRVLPGWRGNSPDALRERLFKWFMETPGTSST